MPSIERHWRLLFVAALLLAAGVTFYLGTRLIAFDGAGGIHPSLNGLDWDTATTSLWFYGAAFWLWRLARRSRTHERARRRALAGDALAIPPADIALDTDEEAPATHLPLVVSWQLAHTGCRATLWRTAVVLLAILLGFAAIIAVLILQVMVACIGSLAVILGTMALLTIAGYVLIARLIRSLPRSTGSRADTIITGEQGITQRRPGKPDLLIPWDQARLLEVWDTRPYTGGRQHWRGYTLYSAAARIEWQEFPASYPQATPDGIARDELIQRQRALLALIHTRTGLTPRTFDDTFQLKDASIPPRRFSLSGTAFALAIAAAFLFAAIAALALPLTHYPFLNLYVAITIAPIGLTILVFFFRSLVSSPTSPASRVSPPAPPLPPPPPIALGAPDQIVALSHTLSLRSRLSGLFGGLLGAVDLVAAVLGGIVENASPSHASVFSTAGLRLLAAAIIIAIPAFIVLVLGWADVFKRATTLQADATGMSKRTGNKETLITWHEIEAVTARAKHGKYTTFAVVADNDDVTIDWLASPGSAHARRNPPSLAISGEELAALVVARSGRTLTIAADE